ncbi:unnamed protein product [Gongylonema pulchrum]|uniref:COMM domain-containing protein n=1 Tax=Gongylonema pulchrum TaxID=637853 RepID=A0A183CYA2_9BILA|nr:unnamed protein product [Gongylonema pulchrum]
MLAALVFILEKTTKSSCSAHDLELEMQQLGLPAAPHLTVSSANSKESEGGKVYVLNLLTNTHENVSIALNDAKLNYLVQELSLAMDTIRPYIRNAPSTDH